MQQTTNISSTFSEYCTGYCGFAFNGQEKDQEIYNNQSTTTATFWEYDGRIGRRWNRDPKLIIGVSDYATLGNNPIFNTDILGDWIQPSDENSKTSLENHWTTIFKIDDETSLMAEVLKGAYSGNSYYKIPDKEWEKSFKKAMKGLSKEQKALAKGYKKAIESLKKIEYSLVDEKDLDEVTKDRLSEAGGGLTEVILEDHGQFSTKKINGVKVVVCPSLIKSSDGEAVSDGNKNTKEIPSSDEVIAHEALGEGYSIISHKPESPETAIQVSNSVREIEGKKTFRTGKDHKGSDKMTPKQTRKTPTF